MDFLVFVGFVGAWVWVWLWLARRLGRNGRGWFVRHLIGSSVGSVAGLLVVSLALSVGIISSEKKEAEVEKVVQEKSPTPLASTEVVKPAAVQEKKTLGFTPDEYAERLNKMLKIADMEHRVHAKQVIVGEVNDVLNISIGKHAALVAGVSKVNGQVLDVVVMGSGDGTPSSGLDIMMVASAALAAAASDVDFSEVFRGLPALIKGQDRTYGDVKLSAQQMDGMGTWFFASPI